MPNINRRQFIVAASAAPLLLWLPTNAEAAATIHELEGSVYINNRTATTHTKIRAGDKIVVAHGGNLVVSIGGDAYLLHGGTALEIGRMKNGLISGLRLLTGALLAVFAKRHQATTHLVTSTATIGIRGTAVYMNAEPHKLYTCTCYGHTDLRFGDHNEDIVSTHHLANEIADDGTGQMAMHSMEVIGHTDDELRMLEALVGRKPPFDA